MREEYFGEHQRHRLVQGIQAAVSDCAVETGPARETLVKQVKTRSTLPDLTEGHHSVGAAPAEAHWDGAEIGEDGKTAVFTRVVRLVRGTEHRRGAVSSFRLADNILE